MTKALAVRQPHAERIASGAKRVEFRTWHTNYRGPLVIIASGTFADVATSTERATLPRSCLVALVDLVNITGRVGDFEWHLANARRLVPTPYTRSRVMTFDLETNVTITLAKGSRT